MQFRVMGPLQVGPTDAAATVPGRKERAVLAALLVDLGRARSAQELVAAVWGADAPPSAEKSLQVRLSHLRSSLPAGREVVVRDGRGYRLAVDPDVVDAYRFERLVDEASRHSPAAALERYDEALALVRGRPYADVEEFEGLAAEVRRLDALRLRAVEGRLRALLDLGRHAEALPELERVVRDEPHHEVFTALLMLALYRAGRQVEALEAYRRTAAQLFELGLEPSEELRRLEARILSHDVETVAPQEARTNLPARLTSFVGRADEIAELGERLRAGRMVTVTGPGGVGKSSLAVEAARAWIGDLDDGVWLVELAALEHPDQVPAAIADAVPFGAAGADLRGEAGEAIDVLCERLGGRRALLVLDTCEHLAAGVARVAERVLGAADGVRVLATSRQPLGAQGEALLELRPFAPDGAEALRLFVERARAAQPAFRLDPDSRAAAATICARLDGLPLAIELAAARVRALPVAEIAARLDDRFALLGDGRDDGGGRSHRTLGAVVAWSFGLLTEAEQELFCRLTIFRGPFTLEGAERVAGGGDVDRARLPDLLASLVERSMVSVEEGRYRLLETLRAFGLQRLEERGGLERCRLRHIAWGAAIADSEGRRLYAEGADVVRGELAPHRPDLDAAAELALDERDGERALPLATALGVLDFGLGDSARGRIRLARSLRLEGPASARVPALIVQSALLTLHGLTEPGRAAATRAHELAEDDRWRDRALAFRGCARLLGGDAPGALADLEGLEQRLTLRGETWLRGFVCGWQGFVLLVLGDLEEARRLSMRAMQAFERCADVWGVLTAAVNLARVDRALGAYDEAARVLERALEIGEQRVPARLGPLLHDFGLVQLRREQFDHAAELLQRCTEVAAASAGGGWVLLSGPAERWYAQMAAGHLARLDGDDPRAAARYADARALLEVVEREERRTIGIEAAIAVSLLAQGEVTDPDASGAMLREALGRAMQSGDRRLVAQSLDALARVVDSPAQGAELLGAAAAIRDGAGGPLPAVDARAVEAIALSLRALVGDEAFDAAHARGREDPMAIALAVVSRP
jgi:predicted ATPase/DNA-binding SARP family transcriptional activator